MHPQLLELLVCPETKQPVRMADGALLARLNARIQAGGLTNRGGKAVTEPVEQALVREDDQVLYRIQSDIPVMLIDESIALDDV